MNKCDEMKHDNLIY